MVKISELRSAAAIAADEMKNQAVRAKYDRTAFANAVAIRVIEYRAAHGLSQTALAKLLNMRQPAIARLEAGDHEPSLTTLSRLARGLGLDFSIDITPEVFHLRRSA